MAPNYFKTAEVKLEIFNSEEITKKYSEGYVLTRLGKGVMDQTRSLRIDLSKFKLNSENKRILRKTEEIGFEFKLLPLDDYSWEIHRLGKIFYEKKGVRSWELGFSTSELVSQRVRELEEKEAENRKQKTETRQTEREETSEHRTLNTEHFGVMSASKIKAMFNNLEEENMNGSFMYYVQRITYDDQNREQKEESGVRSRELERELEEQYEHRTLNTEHRSPIGYCLVYQNPEILHYAYPFYDLNYANSNLGMGMMIRAIQWAKAQNLKYVYLGSVVTPESKYKLQFNGLEWFDTDEQVWREDLEGLKSLLLS